MALCAVIWRSLWGLGLADCQEERAEVRGPARLEAALLGCRCRL